MRWSVLASVALVHLHPDALMVVGHFRNGGGQREISLDDRPTNRRLSWKPQQFNGSSVYFQYPLPSPTIISDFLKEGFWNALISTFGMITRTGVLSSPWRAHPFDFFLSSGYTELLKLIFHLSSPSLNNTLCILCTFNLLQQFPVPLSHFWP